MRIVIDLQACQSESRVRGIGRYSMSLTKAMARQAGRHEIWVAVSDRFPDTIRNIRLEFEGLVPKEQIVTFSVPGPVFEAGTQNAWRVRASELLREHFLAGLNADIVHVSSLFEGWGQDFVSSIGAFDPKIPTTVTLYDLIPYLNQEMYLPDQRHKDHYERKIRSLKNASRLLAISDYSKQEAITALGFNDKEIVNISSAVEPYFKQREFSLEEKSALFGRYKITRPFIMCAPGGFDERKNILGLLDAFSNLPIDIRSEYQLVITGKKVHAEPYEKIIRHAETLGLRGDELIMTDYVPDDDLIALYSLCSLFVFPSLYEGFGLPVLEAMSCGAAVIASNTTSIPEVVGRTDVLFDPARPEEITKLMQLVLKDELFRQSLREYGREQSKKFSWDHSAKKAIAAFEEIYQINSAFGKAAGFDGEVNYKKLITAIAKINVSVAPTSMDMGNTANSIAVNSPVSAAHQILVDVSVLVGFDAKSGIQRVVRSILQELLKLSSQACTVNPIYFDGKNYRYASRFISEFLGVQAAGCEDEVIDVTRGDIYLGLDLSAHVISASHEQLKRLNILGVKMVFVVYDIIFAKHPEWWEEAPRKVLPVWLEAIASVSSGLVCISNAVAVEVKEWLDANPPERVDPIQIGYFHLGADIESSAPSAGLPEDADEVLNALRLAPSFLMVGTIEPRKGHTQTLSAFETLWDEGVDANLVIVGKGGWLMDHLIERLKHHPMLGKRLFWLQGISDEYLERLYPLCKAVLMASEAEGFGLPIIEAARHGIPLILRDLPVFREIAGDHASYFSGITSRSLATALVQWLEQDRLKKTPASKDMRFLSWGESAQYLMNLLQNPEDANWTLQWTGKPEEPAVDAVPGHEQEEKHFIDLFSRDQGDVPTP